MLLDILKYIKERFLLQNVDERKTPYIAYYIGPLDVINNQTKLETISTDGHKCYKRGPSGFSPRLPLLAGAVAALCKPNNYRLNFGSC